jgi:hypothetical protein
VLCCVWAGRRSAWPSMRTKRSSNDMISRRAVKSRLNQAIYSILGII